MKAGQEAERISDALQNIGSDSEDAEDEADPESNDENGEEDEKTDGADRAKDAAGEIYDILSGME